MFVNWERQLVCLSFAACLCDCWLCLSSVSASYTVYWKEIWLLNNLVSLIRFRSLYALARWTQRWRVWMNVSWKCVRLWDVTSSLNSEQASEAAILLLFRRMAWVTSKQAFLLPEIKTSAIILSAESHLWSKQLKKDLHDPQMPDGPEGPWAGRPVYQQTPCLASRTAQLP